MGRHTGFLTSFAAILLAAFSVSVLERRSDGSPRIPRDSSVGLALKAPGLDHHSGSSSHEVSDSTRIVMSHRGGGIRFRVPEHSLVIVGSLDVSGASHSLSISSQAGKQQFVETSPGSQDSVDLEYVDAASLCELRRRMQEPRPCQLDRAASEILKTFENSVSTHLPTNEPSRRFLIPHFEFDQVNQQPSEASPLTEGSRLKVYMDLSIDRSSSDTLQREHMVEQAERVCTTIESEVLPHIERWIGRISDLDGDQRLSVVLTDLDRRKSSSDTPILGCVRRSDFSAGDQSPFAGDIVYLHRQLPPQEQLRALLAHELTHAAIFCIQHEAPNGSSLRDHSVASWLNEAAAHWVERQFCSSPSGYATREAAFRQSPALCPIILPDDGHYHPARRSGSRIAGFTFLQQHLANVSELRELLEQPTSFERSITTVTQAPFSQLFRKWTINQTCVDYFSLSPSHSRINFCSLNTASNESVTRKLHGTAFLLLTSEIEQELCIQAHRDAQLQITVLCNRNSQSTVHSPGRLSTETVRSAELHSMTPFQVR